MKKNLSESFAKLVDSTFENIDGILVVKSVNPDTGEEGYIWGDKWYSSVEEVKVAKKEVTHALNESINRAR